MARISFSAAIAGGMLVCVAACASNNKRSAAPAQEPPTTAAHAPSDAVESRSPVPSPAGPPAAGAPPSRPPSVDLGASSSGQSAPLESAPRAPVEAGEPHGAGASARARFAEARHELEIAASERDCARACRALESMERAAQQVCEVARSLEERRECTSAGEQVGKARSKVQSACGGCPQSVR